MMPRHTEPTRWISDLNGAALPPPDVSRHAGRPRMAGDRYPCGRLKPSNEMAPALWQRIRTEAIRFGEDARLGSELSRLSMLGVLSTVEAAAGLRMGEIYGRFERLMGKRRSARSASYDVGRGGDPDIDEERLTKDELATRIESEKATIEAFNALRDNLPLHTRDLLERLCVEDRRVENVNLEETKTALAGLATLFGKKWRVRKAASGNLERAPKMQPNANHATKTAVVAEPPAKIAFRMAMARLRPDLKADQIDAAWTLQSELAMRLAERERFRREKELRKTAPLHIKPVDESA
jgi:hypothetical protein